MLQQQENVKVKNIIQLPELTIKEELIEKDGTILIKEEQIEEEEEMVVEYLDIIDEIHEPKENCTVQVIEYFDEQPEEIILFEKISDTDAKEIKIEKVEENQTSCKKLDKSQINFLPLNSKPHRSGGPNLIDVAEVSKKSQTVKKIQKSSNFI